jgi:hypothetical protein
MRTFHTGGIFTSELLKTNNCSFSGKIIIPKSLKRFYRTNHGTVVKLQQEANLTVVNWKGVKDVRLDIGSYLYLSVSLCKGSVAC